MGKARKSTCMWWEWRRQGRSEKQVNYRELLFCLDNKLRKQGERERERKESDY